MTCNFVTTRRECDTNGKILLEKSILQPWKAWQEVLTMIFVMVAKSMNKVKILIGDVEDGICKSA